MTILGDEIARVRIFPLDDDGAPWLMTTAELAFHIGRSLDWLYRPKNVAALRARGMPEPHPAFADRHPIMYVRAEIRAWLRVPPPAREEAATDARSAAADLELAERARDQVAAYVAGRGR